MKIQREEASASPRTPVVGRGRYGSGDAMAAGTSSRRRQEKRVEIRQNLPTR